jgi:hypothetical protein
MRVSRTAAFGLLTMSIANVWLDDNRNASVAVAWRRTGETAWRNGLPLFRLQDRKTMTSRWPPDPGPSMRARFCPASPTALPAGRRTWARWNRAGPLRRMARGPCRISRNVAAHREPGLATGVVAGSCSGSW